MRAADLASTMEVGDEAPTDAAAESGESVAVTPKKGSLMEEVDAVAASRTKEAEDAQETRNQFVAFIKRYDDRVTEVRNDRRIRHDTVVEDYFAFSQSSLLA